METFPGEIAVSTPRLSFFTIVSENESLYSPVGSINNTFLSAVTSLSKIDNADVDFQLFVAPTTKK